MIFQTKCAFDIKVNQQKCVSLRQWVDEKRCSGNAPTVGGAMERFGMTHSEVIDRAISQGLGFYVVGATFSERKENSFSIELPIDTVLML